MSNDPVRVKFSDGSYLYSMGDCSSLVSERLYDTVDEVEALYCDETSSFHNDRPSRDEIEVAEADDAENVSLESKYGSGEWSEMHPPYARASKKHRIMTYGPDIYPHDEDCMGNPIERRGFS